MCLDEHCYTGADASQVSDVLKDLKASEEAANTYFENGAVNNSEQGSLENGNSQYRKQEQGFR